MKISVSSLSQLLSSFYRYADSPSLLLRVLSQLWDLQESVPLNPLSIYKHEPFIYCLLESQATEGKNLIYIF